MRVHVHTSRTFAILFVYIHVSIALFFGGLEPDIPEAGGDPPVEVCWGGFLAHPMRLSHRFFSEGKKLFSNFDCKLSLSFGHLGPVRQDSQPFFYKKIYRFAPVGELNSHQSCT